MYVRIGNTRTRGPLLNIRFGDLGRVSGAVGGVDVLCVWVVFCMDRVRFSYSMDELFNSIGKIHVSR